MDIEGGLKPSKRGLTSDCFFNFLQDFQAILYHKLYCLLRKIIHLFRADPEEGLPAELMETLQPGLFSFEEAKAGSFLLGQKLLQGDRVAVGVAKVPVRLAVDWWFVHGRAGRLRICYQRAKGIVLACDRCRARKRARATN